MNAMLFIDGNNLYHTIKHSGIKPSDIDFYKLIQFICAHFKVSCKQAVYYNSMPNLEDGKDRYYSHMKFLYGLGQLPKFEVKTRKLQKHSTREILESKFRMLSDLDLCDKCRPLVEANCMDCVGTAKNREKGIDVMIAIDMVTNALKDNYDCCILVSGDADFIPAPELAEAAGKQVFTCALYRGYSYNLRDKYPYFILTRDQLIEHCLK